MAEKAALITGGSGGIGLAIAKALGEQGYALTLAAKQRDKLNQKAELLSESGYLTLPVVTDVSKEEDIINLFKQHEKQYGRLDVLVNNAGVGIGGAIEGYKTKKLDIQLDVNLRGTYLCTREGIPMLKQAAEQKGRPLIVNMASIAGKSGQGWLAAYSAVKAGIIGLTEATQLELGSSGIQATAICPGFVDTPMTDFVKEHVPAEKMIKPRDIAEAVLFLLKLSPSCVVPEIVMKRPGETI